jgi:hypothetical protein
MMISRRRLLLSAAAITAAAATGAAFVARPYLAKRLYPELDTAYPLGVLHDEEMRAVVALGETLVAPEIEPPVDFFHDYVNSVTQSQHGFLKEYQRAAALLNATSTGLFGQDARLQFSDLPRPRRDKVLRRLLWQYPGHDRIVRKVEKFMASQDALALRIHVMKPLIEHYYRSPYGWAVVGYDSFPGRPPLDPRVYTKLPGDKGVVS